MKVFVEDLKKFDGIESLPSKSYANRLIILGAIGKIKKINLLPDGEDTRLLIKALQDIGIKLGYKNNSLEFYENIFQAKINNSLPLDVGDGGTTGRFLLALLSRLALPFEIKLSPQLSQRPWQGLITALQEVGVDVRKEHNSLFVKGPWGSAKRISVDTSQTSQFISALSLVAPDGFKIEAHHLSPAQKYVDLTHALLKLNQREVDVPADWSNMSTLIVTTVLLGREVTFRKLYPDPLQGDSLLFEILAERGAVRLYPMGVQTTGYLIKKPLQLDISQSQDLFFSLVLLALYLPGSHRITGIENLKYKETSRADEMKKILDSWKVKNQLTQDCLEIDNNQKWTVRDSEINIPYDHRFFMFACCFAALNHPMVINQVTAINKSFPQFLDFFNFKRIHEG